MKRLLGLALVVLSLSLGWGAMQSSVSQYGITWTFDKAYETGQFANGDWWVVGPVTITGITPAYRVRDFWDYTTSKEKGVVFKRINGWQVNPTVLGNQGFDETNYKFDSTLVPALPYLAAPGQSIVKAVSDTDYTHLVNFGPSDPRMIGQSNLLTATVLTVVDAIPPDSGRTVFRPPYVGTDKPYYSTSDLRTDLLPSLAPVNNAPTLSWVEESFRRVQLTHMPCPYGNIMRPSLNIASTYQPYNAVRNDKGALRLLLDDPLPQKMFALTVFVQYGIDVYYFAKDKLGWSGGGYGVEPGHKLPLAFAAVLLDDQAMKDAASDPNIIAGNNENTDIALSPQGIALWGGRASYSWAFADQEQSYWNYIINPPTYNGPNATDPYGYIDNSMTRYNLCDGYQICCLSQPFKGMALTAMLVPGMKNVWNMPEFFQYVDRWVDHGLLAQPDPCAPAEGIWSGGPNDGQRCTAAQDLPGDTPSCVVDGSKYRVTYGPDPNNPGDCIRDTDPSDGIGRFPNRDGQSPDGGIVNTFQDHGYRSSFVDYMWAAYRAGASLAPPVISPAGGTFAGVVDVTLAPDISSYSPTIRYTTDGSDPDATSAVYSAPVRLQQSATLKVRAFFGSYTPSPAATAVFTITADTEGPTISGVSTRKDATRVTVVFSELVDSGTAGNAANYTISGGITVSAANPAGNGPSVVLTTSAMTPDQVYTLTVNNVKDLSGNTITANTQKTFTFINFEPTDGLTGYWPFNTDEGNTVTDRSGVSYNGTVTGADWTAGGRIGGGLVFSGPADNVNFPQEASGSHFEIESTNAFTIACWVKILGHNSAEDEIIGRTNEYGPSPYSIRITSGHQVRTFVGGFLNSTATVADSVWAHVALTYRDSSRVVYINGVRDDGGSNAPVVSLYFPNTRTTKFGNGFTGVLDEVRIYNRVLTPAQIACLAADTTGELTPVNEERTPGKAEDRRLAVPNPVYNLDLIRAFPGRFRVYTLSGRPVETGALPVNGVYLLEDKENRHLYKVILVK